MHERGQVIEYLAFRLASEVYGLPLAHVREILTLPPLTFVPRAPHDILGIISVRGLLVTVVDLRGRLNVERAAPTKRTRLLLVPAPSGEMLGLYVDEVLQVYRLGEAEIEPAANALGGNIAEYVAGIGRRDDTMLILLSLEPLLAPTR